ncbi:MAG TPA: ubiquitin-conjugating enzyme E2 [Solirubrobacteraceae bacterium]|jgi:ubiquitin-protein ligase
MSPRERRLLSDLRAMEDLAAAGHVTFRSEGDPPEVYRLMLNGAGLAKDAEGRLAVRRLHRCDVYLHLEYPRRPPVVTWQTPVFHPNLLGPDRNGGVCLGSWSAAESLADLCRRLHALVTYQSFNTSDALDNEAAAWAREAGVAPGVNVAALAGTEVAPEPLVEARAAR